MKNRVVESILFAVMLLLLVGCGAPSEPVFIEVTVIVPAPTRPIPLMYGREADLDDGDRVARANGDVRACQNMGCVVLGRFYKGDLVYVTGVIFGMNEWSESNRWYVVEWDGIVGYVMMEYLEFEPETNGV